MNKQTHWLWQLASDQMQQSSSAKSELSPTEFPESIGDAWPLVTILLDCSDEELTRMVSQRFGCDIANMKTSIDNRAYLRVQEKIARRYGVFPLKDDGHELTLATSNPGDEDTLKMLAFSSGRRINPVVASPVEIDNAILDHYYSLDAAGSGVMSGGDMVLDGRSPMGSSKIVELASMLVKKAIDANASDIHIQSFLGGAIVRYRIDGVLQRITSLPPAVAINVIRRFKAIGKMDPSNHMSPQDGSSRTIYNDNVYDMRISTLPTGELERLVIRLLHEDDTYLLDDVGMRDEDVDKIKRLIQYKAGLIIVTGPTGSGKTTTLYSCLSELNTVDRNIITAEDPVEYKLHGASQVPINAKQGLSYAAVVRSILRQDPDVLLIGEVRDQETAEHAFRAALTGHVVFTTLHTNDAISAIERLRDLGIAHRDIAYAVTALTSQRLLRKLCEHCAVPVSEPLNSVEQVYNDITGELPKLRPMGCLKCNHTGYSGRQPITQIVEFTPSLAELLADDAPMSEIVTDARKNGMRSLGLEAFDLIRQGKTTVGEALRGLGPLFWDDLRRECEAETHTKIPVNALNEPVKLGENEKLFSGAAKLLLISDQSELITRVQGIFEDCSCDAIVTTAKDGDEAIDLISRSRDYDLILLDLTFEGANGQRLKDYWDSAPLIRMPMLAIIPDADTTILSNLSDHAASDFIVDFLYESLCEDALTMRVKTILHRSDIR